MDVIFKMLHSEKKKILSRHERFHNFYMRPNVFKKVITSRTSKACSRLEKEKTVS